MDRDLLNHLPIVLAVARRGGFAAAAAELGVSPSNVSHVVKTVEDRIGAPLFARTTRSVALTEAGARFTASAGRALNDLAAAWEAARAETGGASGLLRLNAPRVAADWVLAPILDAMAAAHPDVTVELFFDDGLADVVGEGFDAGVRLGGMVSPGMVAVRLTPPFRTILLASPDYLARRGAPERIEDLAAHDCLQYRMTSAGGLYVWDLMRQGAEIQLRTTGRVVVNDMLRALALCRRGVGICYSFEPVARADVEAGRLIALLPEAAIEEDGLSLYFPKRASLAPKLRAFIDCAKQAGTARRP